MNNKRIKIDAHNSHFFDSTVKKINDYDFDEYATSWIHSRVEGIVPIEYTIYFDEFVMYLENGFNENDIVDFKTPHSYFGKEIEEIDVLLSVEFGPPTGGVTFPFPKLLHKCKSLALLLNVSTSSSSYNYPKKFESFFSVFSKTNVTYIRIASDTLSGADPITNFIKNQKSLQFFRCDCQFTEGRLKMNREVLQAENILNVHIDYRHTDSSAVNSVFLQSLLTKRNVEICLNGLNGQRVCAKDVDSVNYICDYLSRSQSVRDLKFFNVTKENIQYVVSVLLKNQTIERVFIDTSELFVVYYISNRMHEDADTCFKRLKSLFFYLTERITVQLCRGFLHSVISSSHSMFYIGLQIHERYLTYDDFIGLKQPTKQQMHIAPALEFVNNNNDLIHCLFHSSPRIPLDIIIQFKDFISKIPVPVLS